LVGGPPEEVLNTLEEIELSEVPTYLNHKMGYGSKTGHKPANRGILNSGILKRLP